MNVLTMQDVRKSFGALEVLKGISLTVGEGEAVSVIGPSGSGKSTLLRCATLLETMAGGSLANGDDFAATMDAEGKSVYADKAALRRIKSRFGLVFQQFNLFPHYTVLKNVTDAPLTVQRRERGEVRALALRPDILFFDEPTSARDPELTGEVLKVIRDLAEEKMTMVIVTHVMAFARAVSDRVIFMDGGVIVEQGDPEQVLGDPAQERTRRFLRSYQT